MGRLKAAGLHFLISAIVVGICLAVLAALWYPAGHQRLLGGYSLMGTILITGMFAWPPLTLLVCKPDKSRRRKLADLVLIGTAQAAFLLLGLFIAAGNRPVYLVAIVDQLHIVSANEIEAADLGRAPAPYNRLSWTGPTLVGAQLPLDRELREKLMWEELSGRAIHAQPRYFVPYEQVAQAVVARAGRTPAEYEQQLPPPQAQRLREQIASFGAQPLLLLPLISRRGIAIAVLDAASLEFLGSADPGE